MAEAGDDVHAFESDENMEDDGEYYPQYYPEEDQGAGDENNSHYKHRVTQPRKIQVDILLLACECISHPKSWFTLGSLTFLFFIDADQSSWKSCSWQQSSIRSNKL